MRTAHGKSQRDLAAATPPQQLTHALLELRLALLLRTCLFPLLLLLARGLVSPGRDPCFGTSGRAHLRRKRKLCPPSVVSFFLSFFGVGVLVFCGEVSMLSEKSSSDLPDFIGEMPKERVPLRRHAFLRRLLDGREEALDAAFASARGLDVEPEGAEQTSP